MSAVSISLIAFGCVFGGAMLGVSIRSKLPESHLNAETRELVRSGMGLIAAMTALVLGLLVSSAKSSFDTQRAEITQGAARIAMLDRLLASYGPEASGARQVLKSTLTDALDRIWPTIRAGKSPLKSLDARQFFDRIEELTPANEAQRSLKAEATDLALTLGQMRWLMLAQRGSSISMPFVIIVIFWLTVIFVSFGVFTPFNATVATTLFICALSVAAAVFLILELDEPFGGLIHVSELPLREAIGRLGQ